MASRPDKALAGAVGTAGRMSPSSGTSNPLPCWRNRRRGAAAATVESGVKPEMMTMGA